MSLTWNQIYASTGANMRFRGGVAGTTGGTHLHFASTEPDGASDLLAHLRGGEPGLCAGT